MTPIKSPKKLIEVALPLDAINAAAAREKSIRHGHPSTLHLWWARRSLAAARAVLFAQMVNDPGYQQGGGFKYGVNKEKAALERERLFKIIEDLVQWENTNNEEVLERARAEIRRSWRETCELNKHHPQAAELFNPDKLPGFHDPFAGGGAIPLEAQRLGLESYASDLNPVAVTINKAMIEIPPRFAGRAPVCPPPQPSPAGGGIPSPPPGGGRTGGGLFPEDWSGTRGLAEDVRRYGAWMRAEAEKRIGHLYPKITVTAEMAAERPDLAPLVGQSLTVIAWLWARTVRSPNPAFSHVEVPLASTFVLSSKEGKQAYVEPVVEGDGYRFTVKVGTPPETAKNGTKLARGSNFRCLLSDSPIEPKYIKSEGIAGQLGARLMAIVAEGIRGRIYLSPTEEHETLARQARPVWKPTGTMPNDRRWFSPPIYGMDHYADIFTPRQLVALTTFSDLVQEAIEKCRQDALVAWNSAAGAPLPTSPRWGEEPVRRFSGWGEEPLPVSVSQRETELNSPPPAGEGLGGGECGSKYWHPKPIPQALLRAARDLRRNMTDAEQLLWQCLRGKQIDGFKFRKQHPIERFVIDFYCVSEKLAIELDGGQHALPEGHIRDAERTALLNRQGVRVLRFWNHEVLGNLEGVLTRIWEALHSPPPQPSPAGGGSECHAAIPDLLLPPAGGGWEGGDDLPLDAGGCGATAYAQAVGVYLACALNKLADRGSSICTWFTERDSTRNTFARQSIPMTWDLAELNTLLDGTGSFEGAVEWTAKSVEGVTISSSRELGKASQADAQSQSISRAKVVSTDPPYYDNIGYADLSDFFYVWLRKSLKPIFPGLYATLAVPKAEELVATPYRHGGKEAAEAFFLEGMTRAIHNLAEQAHPAFPVTIYYAFKQAETKGEGGTSSTGWETFLDAVLRAGFAITGTWPMRTEGAGRMIASGTNALASSIILVCRKRAAEAPTASRREFLRELNAVLPEALADMIGGSPPPPPNLPPLGGGVLLPPKKARALLPPPAGEGWGGGNLPWHQWTSRKPSSAPAWRFSASTPPCWKPTARRCA